MNNLTWLYRNGDWLTQSVITDVAIDYAVENGIEHDGIGEWLLAERNDDSTPKNDVSEGCVDANDANAAPVPASRLIETGNGDNNAACKANSETCLTGQAVDKQADSRDKLEADVLKYYTHTTSTLMWPDDANIKTKWVSVPMGTVLEWLDRQAAITDREWEAEQSYLNAGYKEQIAELTAERDELEAESADYNEQIDWLRAERDRYRALCGQMLDAAHEIRRIADANMPEGAVL